jgi:aspartate/methionine/tyrosine aminotransferase
MVINKSNRLNNVDEYYFSTKLKEIRSLISQGKPIINIGIGSPDLAPPKKVVEAISKAIYNDNNHSYQSYQGLPEFRSAIAKFYKNHYSVDLNLDNEILPLMGSKEGIMHISMAFLNEGDAVLIPNPGYMTYTSVTKLVKAKPIYYDLKAENNWFPDFDALEKLDLSKVKIMWINYPNMPTGSVATKKLFEQLISFAKKHKILLVNDNPYSFVLNQKPLSIFSIGGAKEVALELNSLSKTFNMAGWRVGMLLGKSEYIKTVLQVKSNMDSGMFYGIQKGAIAALEITNGWFDKMNAIYKTRRALVWQILDELDCTYDKTAVGLFVWAKVPNGINSEALTDKLLYEKDVFITPGTIFGTNGEGYIRASLCVNEEKLNEVLNRIIISQSYTEKYRVAQSES